MRDTRVLYQDDMVLVIRDDDYSEQDNIMGWHDCGFIPLGSGAFPKYDSVTLRTVDHSSDWMLIFFNLADAASIDWGTVISTAGGNIEGYDEDGEEEASEPYEPRTSKYAAYTNSDLAHMLEQHSLEIVDSGNEQVNRMRMLVALRDAKVIE